jgi:hypothetical protein
MWYNGTDAVATPIHAGAFGPDGWLITASSQSAQVTSATGSLVSPARSNARNSGPSVMLGVNAAQQSEGGPMRGRKPRLVSIAPADRPVLEQVARSNSLPWYQVRRARIVLANSRGVHNSTVAFQVQCDEATVWRTCRRYEREGLAGLMAPSIRSGRPDRISPPPAGADRPTGLPGADRRRVAHHPLDQ